MSRDGARIDSRTIVVDRTWDGEPVAAERRATLAVTRAADRWHVEVDAPFHGDPPPPAPPGRFDGLWEHAVVELFLVGADGRYLELELGPHGHWLALLLRPVRCRLDGHVEVELASRIADGRWRGAATIRRDAVPEPIERWNAFAIHGLGPARRYLAASAVPGDRPDFHRVDLFPSYRAAR